MTQTQAPKQSAATAPRAGAALPPGDLDLTMVARRPPRLRDATEQWAISAPIPNGYDLCGGDRPVVSVVIVTYDNLVYTKLCIGAILAALDETALELILVDNGSNDGTVEYLRALREGNRGVRVVFNDVNRGFAPANNAGLSAATGEILVLLNNDTMVTPGWLARMRRHLDDPAVGLVGPVTNRIGNEAEVEAPYRTYGQMLAFAEDRGGEHRGRSFEIPMPAMFCLAMRRDAYERIGPLDERFEVGMLEDDDYARRARDAGNRLVCAEDVFVHHFGQASFGKLVPGGEYMRLLEANQRRFKEKWGQAWKPYGRRTDAGYEGLLVRLREVLGRVLPADARVVVASKGDERMLHCAGAGAGHFPQAPGGGYAGHYPADGGEAVAQLERLRAAGVAQFVVFPQPAMWWLDHYQPLRRHLFGRYPLLLESPGTCVMFDLRKEGRPHAG